MSNFHNQVTSLLHHKTKHLVELKKSIVRPLIQIAVKAIEQEYIEEGVLERIGEKYNIPQEQLDEFYSAILIIIRAHLRYPVSSIKPVEFKQTLQELQVPSECIEDLSTVFYGQKRPALLHAIAEKIKFYPQLKSCRWRIDITIASSNINRILEPTIIMEWILSTGERKTFELSIPQFHKLRHSIASILIEMQSLENNSAFKSIHNV